MTFENFAHHKNALQPLWSWFETRPHKKQYPKKAISFCSLCVGEGDWSILGTIPKILNRDDWATKKKAALLSIESWLINWLIGILISWNNPHMGVSKNNGTPKSSHFNRVFHDFHHPFWVVKSPCFWVDIHINWVVFPSPTAIAQLHGEAPDVVRSCDSPIHSPEVPGDGDPATSQDGSHVEDKDSWYLQTV